MPDVVFSVRCVTGGTPDMVFSVRCVTGGTPDMVFSMRCVTGGADLHRAHTSAPRDAKARLGVVMDAPFLPLHLCVT